MSKECWPPRLSESRGDYELSSDKLRIEFDWLHHNLRQQYWCKNIPANILEKAIEHSWTVSVFYQGEQIAFSRLVTDYATFAYLADVFVAKEHRGKGVARWMVSAFTQSEALPELQKWLVITADAQPVYQKSGFNPIAYPHAFLEIRGSHNYS